MINLAGESEPNEKQVYSNFLERAQIRLQAKASATYIHNMLFWIAYPKSEGQFKFIIYFNILYIFSPLQLELDLFYERLPVRCLLRHAVIYGIFKNIIL
jgi:hypothetical protein